MYNTVYTIQYVQMSCTTQYTLYTVCTGVMYNTVYTIQYVQMSCTTQYTLYTVCTDVMYNTVYTVYSMYRCHVQHSIHYTVCTDVMYNTVYTIQYVQMSCTTQYTLYSMYLSHVQRVSSVQYVRFPCTTSIHLCTDHNNGIQYTLYSICTDLMYMQHSLYCTVFTENVCWLQWNCWGQTTVPRSRQHRTASTPNTDHRKIDSRDNKIHFLKTQYTPLVIPSERRVTEGVSPR